MDEHGDEGGGCGVHADLSYFFSQVGEFDLKWGLVLVLLNFHFEFAVVGVLADGNDDHEARA